MPPRLDVSDVKNNKLEHMIIRDIEYRLPRAALWLVSAAMTINPVSIFSGNVACLGLRKADF